MCESEEDVIKVGDHVIVKKLNFKRIYKVIPNGELTLGKDVINMRKIIGKRFWSTFEIVPLKKGKRMFCLKETPQTESWDDLLSTLPSGNDNRSIIDDGTSQKLSKEEILRLQESGKSGKEIVGSLIENNKSFLDRTEYSQEKYLKKKEQKYDRHLTICKPNISSLHDVYFKSGHKKIAYLRMDTLAQLLSYSDVQSDGLYILYDSGTPGLPAAAMLNRIGANTKGHLINLHPAHVPYAALVHAMNFPEEQLERSVNVNIHNLLRLYYQGETSVLSKLSSLRKHCDNWTDKVKQEENTATEENHTDDQILSNEKTEAKECLENINDSKETIKDKEVPEELNANNCSRPLKRKLDESNECNSVEVVPLKKPKWLVATQHAVELLQNSKARGLAIIAKEHPLNIVTALLPFLGASRPFVIYHIYREPLQETYIALKQKQNVINLRLVSNFLRSYQVLPDRTHPDILTSDTGGYLLTGYLVE